MFIELDKNSGVPVKKQLYDAITSKILKRELAKGERLPSTRELAGRLGIARNTVIEIYDQLTAEGYLEAYHGRGTFVAGEFDGAVPKDTLPEKRTGSSARRTRHRYRIDFTSGIPDLKSFPVKAWLRALKESIQEVAEDRLGYGSVLGYLPLRESLTRYLLRYKGISCSPEQVVIVNGTSDAMLLCALLFRQSVSDLMVESAVVSFVPDIFRMFGYNLIPLKIDQYGLCTKDLPPVEDGLIFCSPSHQFPLGGTLPIERRIQLTDYAKKQRHYIIENDYDSEFIYSGAQVNSLYQLTPGQVIHVGTFSKTLAPFLRLGYMVVPEELAPGVKEVQSLLYRRVNTHAQMALHHIFEEGIYVKHVAAMRKRYKKKMHCMVNALRDMFGDSIKIFGTNSGLHVAVVFPEPLFDAQSIRIFLKHKVSVDLLTDYTIHQQETCDTLILGFGNLEQNAIIEGAKRLKAAVSELADMKGVSNWISTP